MKQITIAGGIGKDAVIRRTNDGDAITGFSVGVNDGYGDKKRTIWFDCSIFGKRGEKLADYLTKGSRVVVSGEFGTREYEGKTYFTVRVNEIELMGGGERKEESRVDHNAIGSKLDDEIPF
jgi:single-strand DNA-binding protein